MIIAIKSSTAPVNNFKFKSFNSLASHPNPKNFILSLLDLPKIYIDKPSVNLRFATWDQPQDGTIITLVNGFDNFSSEELLQLKFLHTSGYTWFLFCSSEQIICFKVLKFLPGYYHMNGYSLKLEHYANFKMETKALSTLEITKLMDSVDLSEMPESIVRHLYDSWAS